MKASERYQLEVNTMLARLNSVGSLSELDLSELDSLRSRLRSSRWSRRYLALSALFDAHESLRLRSRHLRLIQGGNEFLARRSQANLTLIVNNETIDQTTSKGA